MIPTPERLRKQAHRLDRRLNRVATVVNAMRGGTALHLYYALGKAIWTLSDGRRVDPAAAEDAIKRPDVVPVGTALFADLKPQTFRFVELETSSKEGI